MSVRKFTKVTISFFVLYIALSLLYTCLSKYLPFDLCRYIRLRSGTLNALSPFHQWLLMWSVISILAAGVLDGVLTGKSGVSVISSLHIPFLLAVTFFIQANLPFRSIVRFCLTLVLSLVGVWISYKITVKTAYGESKSIPSFIKTVFTGGAPRNMGSAADGIVARVASAVLALLTILLLAAVIAFVAEYRYFLLPRL